VTALFGRADERSELLAAFADPTVRLVTITGRGGVGKTRLAAETAPVIGAETGVPVALVGLAGVSGAEFAVSEVTAALGVVAPASVRPQDALAERLGQDRMLLVLDNFEHVLAAANDLRELLDRCPGVRILVTSQAPLRLEQERVLALAPLPVPEPGEHRPKALLRSAAVEIYCNRAAAVDRSFELSRSNAAAVAELCRQLEGLPLAIELVAARAATLPAAEVLRHLDDARLEVVRRPRVDTPDRHDDLRAAIQWTYDLIDSDERQLFRALSVFSGTFDVEAVASVGGAPLVDALDRLETLVDFHLIDPVPAEEPARFQMASSMQAFGRELLVDRGELDAANRAHVAYRAEEARAGAAGLASRSEVLWMAKLTADHDDLTAALQVALEVGLTDEAVDLVVGLAPIWSMRGYFRAQEELLERTLQRAAADEVVSAAYANALLWSGLLGLQRGATQEVRVLVDRLGQGEALARQVGDDATRLRALGFTVLSAPYSGDLVRADDASREGLELAARIGDERWLGQIEAWSGMLATLTGDEDRALRLGRDALARGLRRGDDRTLVLATMLLLPLRRKHPEVATAMPPTHEVLAATRRTGLAMYEGLLLTMIVGDAVATEDVGGALRWASESLAAARSMVGSQIGAYNLMTLVSLAALFDADATAAFFHGAVRDDLPALIRTMSPHQVRGYEAAVERARTRLGEQRFEAEAGRGAQRSSTEAMEDAVAFVREARVRVGVDAAPEVSDSTDVIEPELTRRQREVLDLLAEGLSNKEIAARLDVSPKTVMHHTMAIYKALGVRGRAEAAVVAVQMHAADGR
jgi:predicted ATPase/DNA-binding CsgD family transcriptional regulator